MLTAHPEMHEKRDSLGSGQYGTGGGGGAIDEKSASDQPPPPPPPPQRDLSDPTISAKKLPKKRKFDPSELEEMDKASDVISNVNNMISMRATNQPIIHSSLVHSAISLPHSQPQQSPLQPAECFQVTYFLVF